MWNGLKIFLIDLVMLTEYLPSTVIVVLSNPSVDFHHELEYLFIFFSYFFVIAGIKNNISANSPFSNENCGRASNSIP